MFEPTIFWTPQFLAGLSSTIVAFYVWRRRSAPGAKSLLVLMLATAEWAFLSALHKASPDLSTKILIAKMQYLGIVTVPPALLICVLQYTGRERWLTGRNLILLSIIPVIILALAWTNEAHNLIWKRIWIDISGSIPIGVYDYGPCFWILTSFCYLLVLLSTIWLIQAFISSPRFYRMQLLIMLIGIAAPWVANGLYLLNISPWPRIDLTPIAFTVTGLALGCGMFWVRIFDIVPVAHATVLNSMPDGVIVLDDNKRIVNINPAAQKILCLPNSGIIGQSALQIFANQPTLIEHLRDVTEVGSELILSEGDSQHYYALHLSHFKDRQDSLTGHLITLRDFTQRKRTEKALQKAHDELEQRVEERTAELVKANEQLKRKIEERDQAEEERTRLEAQLRQSQKMEAVGTLAGGIAHDFNNLLQRISGFTEVLLGDKDRSDPDYQNLKIIEQSSQKAADLIGQLLIFSRKVESELKPVVLNRQVIEASKLLERTIPKMISIEHNLAQNSKIINADPLQIEQVLINLGINARDAMPDGGKLIFETENITLNEQYSKTHLETSPGEYVLLSITDTGHGMDKEDLEHIFEPFYTTKEIGKGTGLGLAMVYGIVKSHGGYIMCYSEPGLGTTFKIYFPVLITGSPAEERAEPETETLPGGRETVLLVDDDAKILKLGKVVLELHGYTTIMAESGERAIEIYGKEKEHIDLVILDMGMPGIGGHKCLEHLLKIDPGIKVIIATGYGLNGKVKETLESGAAGYMGKPFLKADMLKRVREVLDNE